MPSPWKISLRYVNNILRKKKETQNGKWRLADRRRFSSGRQNTEPVSRRTVFYEGRRRNEFTSQDYRRDRRRAWRPESNMHFQQKNLQRKKFVDGGREGGFVTYDAKETKKSNTERWTNAEPGWLLLTVHKRKETICCCEHSESIAKTPCSGDEKHRLYHTPGSSLVLQ